MGARSKGRAGKSNREREKKKISSGVGFLVGFHDFVLFLSLKVMDLSLINWLGSGEPLCNV